MGIKNLVSCCVIAMLSLALGCEPTVATVNQSEEEETENQVGGPEDNDVTSLQIDPDVETSNRAIFDAQCEMIFRCCSEEERTAELDIGPEGDEESCKENPGGLSLTLWLAILSEAVQEERIAINNDLVEVCLGAYLEQRCDEWTEPDAADAMALPGCSDMIEPLREEGEECAQDYECTTRFCFHPMNSDDEFGTCTPRAEIEEACNEIPCRPGLYCETFEVICQPQSRQGEECREDRECRSGNCVKDEENMGVCEASLPVCMGS